MHKVNDISISILYSNLQMCTQTNRHQQSRNHLWFYSPGRISVLCFTHHFSALSPECMLCCKFISYIQATHNFHIIHDANINIYDVHVLGIFVGWEEYLSFHIVLCNVDVCMSMCCVCNTGIDVNLDEVNAA